MRTRTERRPRGPGAVYASLSVAFVVLIGFIAFEANQPAPPTIAEFSPQAITQITDAPEEQSSAFGSGDDGTALAGATPPPTPTSEAPAIDVTRVRRCIGEPPRQIEDPQSPPCVPFWEGDNGGATGRGITGDEIRVVVPVPPLFFRPEVIPMYENFFNARFEFYGRKLRLIPGPDQANEVENQQAASEEVDSMHDPFASTSWAYAGGLVYHAEIARRGIVSSMSPEAILDEAGLAAASPHLWSYVMSEDRIFANLGEWACGRLAGRNAEYGGPEVQEREREFGVMVLNQNRDADPSLEPLFTELERCGAQPAYTSMQPAFEAIDTELLRMQEEGVTSIICICNYFSTKGWGTGPWPRATDQGYFPEWILSTWGGWDSDNNFKLHGSHPEQSQHAFGVVFTPRQVTLDQEPFWWALREGNTAASAPPGESYLWWERELYRSLLVLTSGIQMAGPELTPDTFSEALHRTVFPNPDHPNVAGDVGFRPRNHSMTADGAEFWWSNTARSPQGGTTAGSICYLNGGARHTKGSWPKGDAPFFEEPCDSGV